MNRKIPIDQLRPGMYVRPQGENPSTDAGLATALERQIVDIARRPPPPCRVGVAEELVEARRAAAEAAQVLRAGIADVRRGRPLAPPRFIDAADRLAQSIRRNPHALLLLTRVRCVEDYQVQHPVAVSVLLMAFGRVLGMDDEALRAAAIGGLLHDIGTARVDDAVLGRPGRLTRSEFAQVQGHAMEGGRLLREAGRFHFDSIRVVEEHHERADGSGYPAGLCGRGCSLIGQMAAICDAYDAISSDRPYQRQATPHLAMSRLFGWSRDIFNPDLTHQFLRIVGIYPPGTLVRLASGRLALVLEYSGASLLQPVVRAFYDTRRDCPITPEDIDLAQPNGLDGGERVARQELADRWGVDYENLVGVGRTWH
jgi:HD-GYP domain-containing protein (c-di-GMP phosphodiesterase class II)